VFTPSLESNILLKSIKDEVNNCQERVDNFSEIFKKVLFKLKSMCIMIFIRVVQAVSLEAAFILGDCANGFLK
jgi:hypothetical protein